MSLSELPGETHTSWALSKPTFFKRFQKPPETQLVVRSRRARQGKDLEKNHTLDMLVAVCNEQCYIWRSSTKTIARARCSEVWTSTLTEGNDEATTFQEWTLSNQLSFQVTNIVVRKRAAGNGEVCLLWGPGGLAIVRFPTNSTSLVDPDINPGSGALVADCKIIGEKVYMEHPRLVVLQAKWHPSTQEDVVLVLNNDNYIRVYNSMRPEVAISVNCVGPADAAPFNYLDSSVGLMETPIDFDFGAQLPRVGSWIIFLLKSSGRVSYTLLSVLEATRRCHWEVEKPICMEEDLEEMMVEASGFLATKTFPPVLVIGTLAGSIFHSLVLPAESDLDQGEGDGNELNMEEKILSADLALYVKEVIELNPDTEAGFSFLNIIPDPLCSHRYAVIHEEGVHVITMDFVPKILNYLKRAGSWSNESSIESTSSSRYVLSCKLFGSNSYSFTFSDSVPQHIILALINNETLVYEIPFAFETPRLIKSETESPGAQLALMDKDNEKEVPSLNTLEVIQGILRKTTNQPHLAYSDTTDPERFETILLDSVHTLQKEYVQKQEQAMTCLAQSIKTLMAKADEIKGSTQELSDTILELQAVSQGLEEELAQAVGREEALRKRFEAIVFQHQQSLPVMTDAERTWLRTLESFEEEMVNMKIHAESLQQKFKSTEKGNGGSSNVPGSGNVNSAHPPTSSISSSQLLQIRQEVKRQHEEITALAKSMVSIEPLSKSGTEPLSPNRNQD